MPSSNDDVTSSDREPARVVDPRADAMPHDEEQRRSEDEEQRSVVDVGRVDLGDLCRHQRERRGDEQADERLLPELARERVGRQKTRRPDSDRGPRHQRVAEAPHERPRPHQITTPRIELVVGPGIRRWLQDDTALLNPSCSAIEVIGEIIPSERRGDDRPRRAYGEMNGDRQQGQADPPVATQLRAEIPPLRAQPLRDALELVRKGSPEGPRRNGGEHDPDRHDEPERKGVRQREQLKSRRPRPEHDAERGRHAGERRGLTRKAPDPPERQGAPGQDCGDRCEDS